MYKRKKSSLKNISITNFLLGLNECINIPKKYTTLYYIITHLLCFHKTFQSFWQHASGCCPRVEWLVQNTTSTTTLHTGTSKVYFQLANYKLHNVYGWFQEFWLSLWCYIYIFSENYIIFLAYKIRNSFVIHLTFVVNSYI